MFRSLTENIRLAALAAMVGGSTWAVTGAIQLTGKDELRTDVIETTLEHVLMAAMSAALLLTVPAILLLARRARTPRPGYAAAAGMVALAIAVTVSNVNGEDPLFFLVVAPVANALWLFGTIGLAVSAYRAGAIAKPVAFALPAVQVLCLPLSIVGGGIAGGAIWIAIGYLMSVGALNARPAAPAVA